MKTGEEKRISNEIINNSDMKLLITKYIKNPTYTNVYLPDNYFTGDGIDVVDYITINKIPSGGIPVFSEELTKQGEPMQFKCGDYDVKLSMLDETKSNLDKSVIEFFQLDKKYIIRVMIESNDELKSFGFIDIGTIKFDRNISESGCMISFTVYSGELEWHNYAIGKKFDEFAYINQGRHGDWDENDMNFGTLMNYFLSDTNVVLDNRTNLDEIVHQKCGFTPKTSPLQKVFVNESYWQVFRDILIGFGIMYKLAPNSTYCTIDSWGKPNIILFYRKNGIDINELKVLDRIDGYNASYDNETFMMLFTKFKDSLQANERYEGFINNTDSRTNGGLYCINIEDVNNVYNGWDIFFNRNGVQEFMFREKICVLDSGLKLVSWSYDDFGSWGEGNNEISCAAASRFFVETYSYTKPPYSQHYIYSDGGFPDITNALLPNVYDFIVASLKKSMTLKIVCNELFDTSIYNRVILNNLDYWIEKVYDADMYQRTAKVKIVEI